MKILFCNYEYPPLGGGGGVVNASLAEALASKHEVTVLTSSAQGLAAEEVVNGVQVLRVPVYVRSALQTANIASLLVYVWNARRMGADLLKRQQFDVINTHFVVPTGPVGDYLSKKGNLPNVLSAHGGDIYDPSKFLSPHKHLVLRKLARKLLTDADEVIVHSRNIDGYIDQYYSDSIPTNFIPLGIPRPVMPSPSRQKFGIDEDDFVMITVGRLVDRKGVDQLVSMMARMKQTNARLVVIGGGPKLKELQAQSEKLGVQSRILFAGQASEEEKLSLLALSDVYVSTSQHEGFGLVFLEGMAFGLPVVCYDEGGQTDFVSDGNNGFVVKLNDLDEFTRRVESLRTDTELRSGLSAGSLESVEDYFIDTCAASYAAVFETAIANHRT